MLSLVLFSRFFLLFWLIHVYIHLRIRDSDTVIVERQFDLLDGIEIDRPVIRGLDPGAVGEVDTAVTQFGNRHHRCRIREDQRIVRGNLFKKRFRRPKVVIIPDTERQIDTLRLCWG